MTRLRPPGPRARRKRGALSKQQQALVAQYREWAQRRTQAIRWRAGPVLAEAIESAVDLALVEAASTWDGLRSFEVWAWPRVVGAAIDEARKGAVRADRERAYRAKQRRSDDAPDDLDGLLEFAPERDRQLLRLYYHDRCTDREVAERLGLSNGEAARSRRHRALEFLRARLEDRK